MTEQEAMQILADMGLHEGGMDNWVPDNAWYRFANVVEAKARADERETCADIAENWHSNGSPRVGVAAQIRARGTT
jgi:hypothetical protein